MSVPVALELPVSFLAGDAVIKYTNKC